jgi:hypothetical protein
MESAFEGIDVYFVSSLFAFLKVFLMKPPVVEGGESEE